LINSASASEVSHSAGVAADELIEVAIRSRSSLDLRRVSATTTQYGHSTPPHITLQADIRVTPAAY
jgi:hypothetical protein